MTFKELEERLTAAESELGILVRVIEVGGAADTLRSVRREAAAADRKAALETMGGAVSVSMLGGAPGFVFAVPGGAGVAAIVYRRCRGGDVQSTEIEPHEFETVGAALEFLDLTQDTKVVFVGADAGEDIDVELAQVAGIAFTPADEINFAREV